MRVTEGVERIAGQRVQRDCRTVAKLLPSIVMMIYAIRATPEQVWAVLGDVAPHPDRDRSFDQFARGLKARVEAGGNG